MYGGPCVLKKCKIVPHFDLPDLIKLKRIQYPCIMDLNEHEILRAINYADVFEVLEDGTEILLHKENFNKDNTEGSESHIYKYPLTAGGPSNAGDEELSKYDIVGLGAAGIGLARLYS